jgi:hypothetical protein
MIYQLYQTIECIFAKNPVSIVAEDKVAKINSPHPFYVAEERSMKSLNYEVYFSLRFGLFVIPSFSVCFSE